jgi:hypothetical protein
MEAALSEQKCQCGLQWAEAIGVRGGAGWRTRRIAESYDKEWYGAGDRGVVIHDGKVASFCRSCRFVCSFIAHLPPFFSFLHRSFSFDFFKNLFSSRLLSLHRIFPHSPAFTAQ